MRAGFRREIPGERKLEWGAHGHGEEGGIVEGEEFDFLGGRQKLRRILFLLFGLLDRIAHVAGVLAVEGFFRTGEDGSVLRGVGPDHICPGHGLKNSPVASNDKKQRDGGYDLAAECEDFSTEHGHGRGDWLSRGDYVNVKNQDASSLLPLYSASLLRRVRMLIWRSSAAWVRLPFVRSRASKMARFSSSWSGMTCEFEAIAGAADS